MSSDSNLNLLTKRYLAVFEVFEKSEKPVLNAQDDCKKCRITVVRLSVVYEK